MLKSIDLLVGLKLLCNRDLNQLELSQQIASNPAQVNRAIKILLKTKLFYMLEHKLQPNIYAWEKLLLAIEHIFPANVGGIVVGIPTAYAAAPIANEINAGSDPIPVWACANGRVRGLSVEPLHPNVPKALFEYPDQDLYTLLVLIDALRVGRARERELGQKYLLAKLQSLSEKGLV